MIKNATLHILMRDDLTSLNPGKAIAQGSHATNDFEAWVTENDEDMAQSIAFNEWRDNRTFGLCYTRAAKPYQIEEIDEMVQLGSRFGSGKIVDPTYPIQDGEVVHYIPLLTCGWVFTWQDDEMSPMDWKVLQKLKKLSLYN